MKTIIIGFFGLVAIQGAALAKIIPLKILPPDTLQGLPLVFTEDFESGWDKWEIFDQPSFKLTEFEGNTFLQVPQLSSYRAPVRGPSNRVMLRNFEVRDFILEARVRITEEPFRGHRGGLFIFGYQDPSNLYYIHFAEVASDRSNTFAKVADAPRFTFYKTRSDGIPWTMHKWQKIRVVRKFKQGIMEGYVDDMTKPVLVGDDLTYQTTVKLYEETGLKIPVTETNRFEWGRVGIGSFQGMLDYDDVTLWAEVKRQPTAIRPSPDALMEKRKSYPQKYGQKTTHILSGKKYFSNGKRL